MEDGLAALNIEEKLLPSAPAEDWDVYYQLLTSHLLGSLAYNLWAFCTPLILLTYTPGTLLGPGLFGLTSYCAGMFGSPLLGARADAMERLRVIRLGVTLQISGALGNALLILLASSVQSADVAARERPPQTCFLILSCCCGVMDRMSFSLTHVPLKRDWVPALMMHDAKLLQKTNARMSQVFNVAAIVAPFIAAIVLRVLRKLCEVLRLASPEAVQVGPSSAEAIGFCTIALLVAMCAVLQYAVLRRVHFQKYSLLKRSVDVSSSPAADLSTDAHTGTQCRCFASWQTWLQQPFELPLLSMSYAMIYFTVLSPSSPLLTAYLRSVGVPPMHLSILRSAGAAAGFLGISFWQLCGKGGGPGSGAESSADSAPARSKLLGNIPEHWVNRIGVGSLATFIILAAVAYDVSPQSHSMLKHSFLPVSLYVFAACVVLARPGLYAFELGVLSHTQALVNEQNRAAVGVVDDALTAALTLCMMVTGTLLNKPPQFGVLVHLSASAVTSACITYCVWSVRYCRNPFQP